MGITINRVGLISTILQMLLLTAVILLVSYFAIKSKPTIGPILIILSVLTLLPLLFLKIPVAVLRGDIIFGMIDNGILALFALSGAEFFGILGAVVGGLVGNAITDGLAGIFEGYEWQRIKKLKIKDGRTALTVAIGKLSGCLLGAGVILTIAWSI
ncbi:hypothetical protein HYU22_02875 [Candidatus Woesearchaeota archaeon]|nr:hypothetical protein [Candidatus Woesearchaeota archaeon]